MKNKILFIVATHGNEDFSIEVLKKLENVCPKNEYGYDWIIGNPRAQEKSVRYIEKDLNRSAPGDITSDIYEEKRAAEIIEISKNYDCIIDVHGTKSDLGIITIIPYPTLQNLLLASLFSIKKNVIWYAKSSLKQGSLVQFVDKPAIEIECGPKNDKKIQEDLYIILEKFLTEIKETISLSVLRTIEKKNFYHVYDKLLGEHNSSLQDFKKTTINKETFYPFLSGNEYKGITCYKMKKIEFENLFLT